MKRLIACAVLAAPLLLPVAAQAGADGSQQPAGGAHMSSYVHHHSHDPRSLHAQRNSTGQILGAPMLSERAGAHGPRLIREETVKPFWATGPVRRAR